MTEMTDPIILTDRAARKVWDLIQEDGNLELKLRAYVTGGGCSGMQYGFTFDEEIKEDDTSVLKQIETEAGAGSVYLLVDSMSFQYLVGATIDYIEDLEGSRFSIANPNAKGSCGCGSSFSS